MLVAYYRVSTGRQGRSGLGLEAQRAAVEEYARRAGRRIVAAHTEVESGRCRHRPRLAAAIAAAKAPGATLIVAKIDRLARDVRLILELVDSGVPLFFLDFPDLPTSTAMGRMVLVTMANLAEFESRRIGERIREALARRRVRLAAGGKRERKVVFGREHQRAAAARWHELNRLAAAEHRRDLYPLALGLRTEGRTLAGVAAELNARGVPTRRGRAWTPGLVHWLLKGPQLPPRPGW